MQLSTPPVQFKEVHTRFLFPFFFDQWKLNEATTLLEAQRFSRSGDDAGVQPMWHCNPSAGLYQDEVLEHVTRFLFREASNTCRYLKLSGNVLNSIFHHHVLIELSSGQMLPVKPSKAGVELFLMTHGVGLLSLALSLAREVREASEVVDFNYKLARYNPMPAAEMRIPHPDFDKEWAARIPEGERSTIPKPPDSNAPRKVRMGVLGGVFRMPELIDEILVDPLRELNCRPAQQGLAAYTVVRFSSETDFSEAGSRNNLVRFLSALAQVEESGHAGAVVGDEQLTAEVLNAKHWAAVGLLSAVHLIADQPAEEGREHPFNEQRVPRVRDKYFIPFLMASLQKLFLERTMREASAYMEFSLDPRAREFMRKVKTELRETLLSTNDRIFKARGSDTTTLARSAQQALVDSAARLFNGYRSGLDLTDKKESHSGSAPQDRNQILSFLSEDLKRTIEEQLDIVFSHSSETSRRKLHHRTETALVKAVDEVFSQHKHFARQLDDVLQFAVQGHFVQVSSRQVLHRFYRLAQEGLDIPNAWKEVNYAISNIDRKLAAQREHDMSKTMTENLVEIGRVQRAVHVLEFVIIGVYAAEVFHIFTSHDHMELPLFSYPLYVLLALIGGVLLAMALNFVFARWYENE